MYSGVNAKSVANIGSNFQERLVPCPDGTVELQRKKKIRLKNTEIVKIMSRTGESAATEKQ